MRLSKFLFVLMIPLACFGADEFQTQLGGVQQELQELKQNQREIQKTLQIVKDILMGKQPPLEDVLVTVAGSPMLGDERAKLVLVEFSDYQCPYCGAFARQTFSRLTDEYVKTGKMRYVLRDFPLEEAHPLAEKAGEAAHCASEQGKY